MFNVNTKFYHKFHFLCYRSYFFSETKEIVIAETISETMVLLGSLSTKETLNFTVVEIQLFGFMVLNFVSVRNLVLSSALINKLSEVPALSNSRQIESS